MTDTIVAPSDTRACRSILVENQLGQKRIIPVPEELTPDEEDHLTGWLSAFFGFAPMVGALRRAGVTSALLQPYDAEEWAELLHLGMCPYEVTAVDGTITEVKLNAKAFRTWNGQANKRRAAARE